MMQHPMICLLALVSLLGFAQPVAVDATDAEVALLSRILSGQSQVEDYSEDFLTSMPFAQVPQLLAQLEQQFGSFESVQRAEDGEGLEATFSWVTARALLLLDAEGKVEGFRFPEITPRPEITSRHTASASQPKPASSQSNPLRPAVAMLAKVFTQQLREEDLSEQMLAQVPLAQLESIIREAIQGLGAYQDAEVEAGEYEARFAQGRILGSISLNTKGEIQGLYIREVIPTGITLASTVREFEDYLNGLEPVADGHLLLLRYRGEQVEALAEYQPQRALAVGSAFKMAVLATLQQQIEAGSRNWDDVVYLHSEDISYPSGMLQDWAPGSALTLETLANLMISISDNTATDALMRVVGLEAIEAQLASLNIGLEQPFMRTRELFHLRMADEATQARYLRANKAGQRQILDQLAQQPRYPLAELEAALSTPGALEAEWYFNAPALCQLLRAVAALPSMQLNSGAMDANAWQQVAFKGGSEAGVLNLSTWLRAEDASYCLITTVNNPAASLDEARIVQLHQQLARALHPQE